jgi:ketosteroid isomerase-like protein
MSTERNRRVAMDFLVTAGRGDMEAFLATITDDVEFQTMGCSIVSAKRNRAELIELVKLFDRFMATPIEFEFLTVTAEDDRVALEARSHAKMVDGRPYENIYHCLFWMRDGRVARMHEYMDTKYADSALGPLLGAVKK